MLRAAADLLQELVTLLWILFIFILAVVVFLGQKLRMPTFRSLNFGNRPRDEQPEPEDASNGLLNRRIVVEKVKNVFGKTIKPKEEELDIKKVIKLFQKKSVTFADEDEVIADLPDLALEGEDEEVKNLLFHEVDENFKPEEVKSNYTNVSLWLGDVGADTEPAPAPKAPPSEPPPLPPRAVHKIAVRSRPSMPPPLPPKTCKPPIVRRDLKKSADPVTELVENFVKLQESVLREQTFVGKCVIMGDDEEHVSTTGTAGTCHMYGPQPEDDSSADLAVPAMPGMPPAEDIAPETQVTFSTFKPPPSPSDDSKGKMSKIPVPGKSKPVKAPRAKSSRIPKLVEEILEKSTDKVDKKKEVFCAATIKKSKINVSAMVNNFEQRNGRTRTSTQKQDEITEHKDYKGETDDWKGEQNGGVEVIEEEEKSVGGSGREEQKETKKSVLTAAAKHFLTQQVGATKQSEHEVHGGVPLGSWNLVTVVNLNQDFGIDATFPEALKEQNEILESPGLVEPQTHHWSMPMKHKVSSEIEIIPVDVKNNVKECFWGDAERLAIEVPIMRDGTLDHTAEITTPVELVEGECAITSSCCRDVSAGNAFSSAAEDLAEPTEVFLRPGVLVQLEATRDEKLADVVVQLQSRCRGYLARKKLSKLKIQDVAVRCIQRNVRKLMLVREWSWWRLYVKVTPLLNVHRTEQELSARLQELEAIKSKLEKVEAERNQLKLDNERLEGKLSELAVDLSEERATGTSSSERLDAETSERIRLEHELSVLQHEKKNLQQQSERLEMELFYARADVNGLSEGEGELDDPNGAAAMYKQKCERAMRELEFTRRRLQQQHEDDLEQLVGLKKQLEKKLADAYEEVEEQRQVVGQWKRKVQKLQGEMSDLRLLLEEQNSRNNLLEKKQRKFDSEIQMLQDELRSEKSQRDRSSREREIAFAEKFSLEQNLSSVRLELELKEEKVVALSRELEEVTRGGGTEQEVTSLRKAKHDLEIKLKEQEEELDELAGQVSMLEGNKLRLEMSLESLRKEHRRDMAQRDDELDEVRSNAQKKVKGLEAQIESNHEERTLILREKHELERRLTDAEDRGRHVRAADEDALLRLRRDLTKTKALLRDAQVMLERAKQDSPSKAILRSLKNQLDDMELARASAVKAKQSIESELSEVSAQLEEVSRAKDEAESRNQLCVRESNGLKTQLEDNEEELQELLKKYRQTVQQLSAEQMKCQETAGALAEAESERSSLRDQLAEATAKLEATAATVDPTSGLAQKRLEIRVKELESRLELELTTRARLEVQISRLKENVERLGEECAQARNKEQTTSDSNRKLQRTLREAKEELSQMQAKEQEAGHKRRELEKRVDAAEQEAMSARTDLRLAVKRIEDLQTAISGEIQSDSDRTESEGETDSGDESLMSQLASSRSTSRASRSSDVR